MIIQTGMRTDIPAFYAEWFANRLKEGFVMVRNPYHPVQVTRYRLDPAVVDLIGFCSKNPGPMLPYLDLLRLYGMYWFVTVTPYGREIEPRVPDKAKVLADFKRISEFAGRDSMGWRYDPIILNETYTKEYHLEQFERMAEALEGSTGTCVISFIDLYQKVRKNFPEAVQVAREDRLYLGERMARIAGAHGMTLRPCGEGDELAQFGADCSGCMTVKTYETALHRTLRIPSKTPLRKECACFLGGDIGAYNTCLHGCRYCYANYDQETVYRNYAKHDPNSPFLIGGSMPEDEVHEAEQKSWVRQEDMPGQLTLDLLLG